MNKKFEHFFFNLNHFYLYKKIIYFKVKNCDYNFIL
jgi:hypothetical protein